MKRSHEVSVIPYDRFVFEVTPRRFSWRRNARTVVTRRFSYCFDGLFLFSVGVYVLNRWVIKPHFAAGFVHDHLNDLLLIPAALPPMILLHRRLGLRNSDTPPTFGEVAFHLGVWSVLCEFIGPLFFKHSTGDFRDIIAYCTGGLLAWVWWNRPRRKSFA